MSRCGVLVEVGTCDLGWGWIIWSKLIPGHSAQTHDATDRYFIGLACWRLGVASACSRGWSKAE